MKKKLFKIAKVLMAKLLQLITKKQRKKKSVKSKDLSENLALLPDMLKAIGQVSKGLKNNNRQIEKNRKKLRQIHKQKEELIKSHKKKEKQRDKKGLDAFRMLNSQEDYRDQKTALNGREVKKEGKVKKMRRSIDKKHSLRKPYRT